MTVETEAEMGRKKSEERKHTGLVRVTEHALDRGKLAASLMRMSLADYVSAAIEKAADRDIPREAGKLTKGQEGQP